MSDAPIDPALSSNNNTLAEGMAGRYEFKIGHLISEGWDKVCGVKASYWGAVLCYLGVMLLLVVPFLIACLVLGLSAADFKPQASEDFFNTAMIVRSLFSVLVVVILAPLHAGIFMIGIKRAINAPTHATMIFHYYQYWQRLWVLPVIVLAINFIESGFVYFVANSMSEEASSTRILAHLGVVAFALLKIYIYVSYLFFAPLIVEKKLSVGAALEASRKAISHHFFKTFFYFVVICGIFIVSAIPLLIPFIWTLPMVNNMMGIFYRNVFGVQNLE